jgi:hypothetical protein
MPGRYAGMSRAMRCAVMLRDRKRCVYCDCLVLPRAQVGDSKQRRRAATMDHVTPGVALFVCSCWRCNGEKGARSAAEWSPEAGARAAEALSRPLDLLAGREWARELYPRPLTRGQRAARREAFSVNAAEEAAA